MMKLILLVSISSKLRNFLKIIIIDNEKLKF